MLTFLLGQAETSSVAVQSIWDFILKGGVMMIPLGIVSLVALTVVIERSVSLKRRRVIPDGFIPRVEQALRSKSRGLDQAREVCRQEDSPIGRIFAAALRRSAEPLDQLERHVEQAGQREVFKLRKYLRVLSVSAAIAPLLGLLGTIIGMIRAFQTVATSGEALGRAEMLAQGIYEAMITTAAGLLIAIPALIAYHWLTARIERLVAEIDEVTLDFIETHLRPAGRAVATPPHAAARGNGSVETSAADEPGASPEPAPDPALSQA